MSLNCFLRRCAATNSYEAAVKSDDVYRRVMCERVAKMNKPVNSLEKFPPYLVIVIAQREC